MLQALKVPHRANRVKHVSVNKANHVARTATTTKAVNKEDEVVTAEVVVVVVVVNNTPSRPRPSLAIMTLRSQTRSLSTC